MPEPRPRVTDGAAPRRAAGHDVNPRPPREDPFDPTLVDGTLGIPFADQPRRVAADIKDPTATVPWDADCATCHSLRQADEPGVHTWLLAIADHMLHDHKIRLVQS